MKGKTLTKAEKLYHDELRELGCIVCILESGTYTPPQIHHRNGKTKDGAHMDVLGLCYCHHMADQQQPKSPLYVSRHPHKAMFEERYGTEQYLQEQTALYLGAHKKIRSIL